MIGDDVQPSNFVFVGNTAEQGKVNSPGGITFEFTAATALLVGDAVYLDANGKAAKSLTSADYLKCLGIVVGGTNTFMHAITRELDVGVSAADADETVIVCTYGKAWAIAAAAITLGGNLTVAVTAGRVDDAAGATAGQIIGNALEAATTAGEAVLIFVNHR